MGYIEINLNINIRTISIVGDYIKGLLLEQNKRLNTKIRNIMVI
jgi:hypothetical protein